MKLCDLLGMTITVSLSCVLMTVLVRQKPRPQKPSVYSTEDFLRDAQVEHNKIWFAGKLPPTAVYWAETPDGDEGETICNKKETVCEIFISPRYNPGLNEAEFTLFHEDCHEAEPQSFDHGPAWQNCMKSLADRGAFEKLW
jgi:hypothetical protein